MKAIVSGFSVAGALVPIFMLGVSSLQGGVFQWPTLGILLWPSWIMLMATSGREGATSSYAILGASIALNIVLYSLVGALIGALLNFMKADSMKM